MCGLVCSGYASIIYCPNLVDQGDTISGKLLSYLVNAVARRGPGPEDTALICEKQLHPHPVRTELGVPRVGSAVPTL